MPETADVDDFLASLRAELGNGSDLAQRLPLVLDRILTRFDCPAGTIHLLDPHSQLLKLGAARGMPDVVLMKIATIPVGKGMAGIAAERREPVQICNLQTDTSGVVKPGARETKMEGSVASPMISSSGELKGTLGVAKPVPYDFPETECDLLLKIGEFLADHLSA